MDSDDIKHVRLGDETNLQHHTHHVVTVKNEAEKQKMVHGLVDVANGNFYNVTIFYHLLHHSVYKSEKLVQNVLFVFLCITANSPTNGRYLCIISKPAFPN